MIGSTIAHYKILERLGQGGMGVVYKAEDTRLERVVALKFLPESLRTDPAARARFLQEARAASRLKHPNVLTVHAVEESDSGDFIVMEFAESGTLRDRIGSLPTSEIIAFMIQAAHGLQAAHERGIIHRDIKPDNLLVDSLGRLRITDFGLARSISEHTLVPATGTAFGTAHYMSPEQVTGARLDPRSDIFSLGVTFFEMLARRRPFEGDYVMSVLYAIANEPAPELSEFAPDVPSELEAIIARCLAKSCDARFASCSELASALALLQTSQPRTSEPTQSRPATRTVQKFRGREHELEKALSRLRAAATGSGYTLILAGESGVGKTRLAEAVTERARDLGMGVLVGRCLPQGGGLPFHPYVSALRHILPRLDEGFIEPLERRAAELDIELRHRLPILKSFLNMSGPATIANQEQLWDSLLMLLRVASAERPLVLFLDDLQWADEDTLRFFGFIARSISEFPVVQMATRRVDGRDESATPTQASSALIHQLRGDGFAEIIEVQRLPKAETIALAADLLGGPIEDPGLADMIINRTDGNPLYVRELMELIRQAPDLMTHSAGLKEVVPGRIRDIVSQRIGRLSSADRELLEFAACDPERFDSDVLQECLGVARIPLLRTLQRLEEDNRLIRHDGPRYRFDHPLVREVIYAGILPELRTEYHRMIAATLIGRHKDSAEHASRIAFHLQASGQKEVSVGYLLRAAERAHDLCAMSEAMRLYGELESIIDSGTALSANDAIRFDLGFADVLLSRGMTSRAQMVYERALKEIRRSGTSSRIPDVLSRLSAPYRMLGDLERARTTAEAAVQAARDSHDESCLIESLAALAMVHVPRAEYAQTIKAASEVLALSEGRGDVHHQSVALSLIGAAHLHAGEYRLSADHLDRAIAMQRSIGDQRGLASSLNFAGLAYHRLAEFSRSVDLHNESLRIKRAIQEESAIPGSLNSLGDVYRDMGQLERALQYHNESLAMAQRHSNRGAECDNLRDLGADFILQGNAEEAERHLDQVLRLATDHKYPWYETRACSSKSDLSLLNGDVRQALVYADRALELARRIGARELLAEALVARGRSLAAAGEVVQATSVLQEARTTAQAGELRLPLRQIHLMLAQLLETEGDAVAARAAYAEAAELLQRAADGIADAEMRRTFLATPLSMAIVAERA